LFCFFFFLPFSQLLSRHVLRIRNKVYASRKKAKTCSYTQEMKEKYENIIDQLEATLAIFEKENALKPFTVLGIEASDSLTLTIASGISSFYFALLSLFFAHSAAVGAISNF
jgi:hypothetical protein